MSHRGECAGLCCQNMAVASFTPDDLRVAYEAWMRGDTTFVSSRGEFPMIRDIHLLYPMLRPLGAMNEHGESMFDCVHWSLDSRLCRIYPHRPVMCVEYPGHGPCLIPGCTMEPVVA